MAMNLPDFFLADLPPTATLTPAMIATAGEVLKRNREKYLLPRPTADIVKNLCQIGAAWLQPENKFRRLALEFGPAETGFSRPILARGLDQFFRRFTPEHFSALLVQELGSVRRLDEFDFDAPGEEPLRSSVARGPELLVHFAAGNLPSPALLSLTLGLLTRSAQFMKCASGAAFLPRLFAHSIYEWDHKLGACLEMAVWRGGELDLETALLAHADCVTATGSDETLAAIRSRLPVPTRFLGYGQRVSFGFITREALREENISQLVARAADDIVAWDQNGCLSPHAIYIEERGAIESDKFAELLALELARRELIEPRGKISVAEAAAIATQRATFETLAAHRGDAKIWSSHESTAWTVVFMHDPRFQFSPANRFILIKPVAEARDVFPGIDLVRGKVSTVGLAAGPEKFRGLAKQFAHWGVTRICPLGEMQNPPLTWRHDGRPALGDLVMWTELEA